MAFFVLEYLFSFSEIFTFLYYAIEESDDVIGGVTKTVQHSIESTSKNFTTVFVKLGNRTVHHKKKTK